MENNKGYYRGDIWFANLSDFNLKNHPVLIISNWKNNSKKKTITGVLISSQLENNMSGNVEIEGYGLNKKSKVIVNNIKTFEKSKLLYKIGHIDDEKMLEVDMNLKRYLQLDNRYCCEIGEEALENFFTRKMNKENQEEKRILQKSKVQLWNLYLNKQYKDVIQMADEIEILANKTSISNKNEYIYYALHVKTLSYIKKNRFKEGLESGRKSLIYIGNPNNFNKDYAMVIWTIARCYEGIGDNESAIRNYKSLAKYYKQINDVNGRISCIFNYAKLYKNIKAMEQIRNIIIKIQPTNQNFYNKSDYTQEILNQMNNEINDLKNRL